MLQVILNQLPERSGTKRSLIILLLPAISDGRGAAESAGISKLVMQCELMPQKLLLSH